MTNPRASSYEDMDPTIRVFIVHDQRMLAEGLRLGLEAEFDLEVVGVAASLDETMLEVAESAPDVALIELALGDENGITVGEHVKARFPDVKMLLLTGNAHHDTFITQAIGAGFDGFLHKHASLFEAVHAIHRVHDGETVFAPEELTHAVHAVRRNSATDPTDLTEREFEILQLVAQGMSTAKIAAQLYVSPHTVRSHVGHLLAKLDTHSKGEAVAVGYRRGLISLP